MEAKGKKALKLKVDEMYELLAMCDAPRDVDLRSVSMLSEVTLRDMVLFAKTRGAYLPTWLYLFYDWPQKNDVKLFFSSLIKCRDAKKKARLHDMSLDHIVAYPGELVAAPAYLPRHANVVLFHKPMNQNEPIRVYLFEPNGGVMVNDLSSRRIEKAVGELKAPSSSRSFEFGGFVFGKKERGLQGVEGRFPSEDYCDARGYCQSWANFFAESALMHWYKPPKGMTSLRKETRNPVGLLMERVLGPFRELTGLPLAGKMFRKIILDYAYSRRLELCALYWPLFRLYLLSINGYRYHRTVLGRVMNETVLLKRHDDLAPLPSSKIRESDLSDLDEKMKKALAHYLRYHMDESFSKDFFHMPTMYSTYRQKTISDHRTSQMSLRQITKNALHRITLSVMTFDPWKLFSNRPKDDRTNGHYYFAYELPEMALKYGKTALLPEPKSFSLD
jgi:hypothetical protein